MVYHFFNVFSGVYLGSVDSTKQPIPQNKTMGMTDKTPPQLDDKNPFLVPCWSYTINDWVLDEEPILDAHLNNVLKDSCAKLNPNSKLNYVSNGICIVDDFYLNPMEVREEALKEPFYQRANFSAKKTVNFKVEGFYEHLSKLLGYNVSPSPNTHTGCYKVNKESDAIKRNCIHGDRVGNYFSPAAIIYLNLPEECKGGTSIYRHKKSGMLYTPLKTDTFENRLQYWIDGFDMSNWDVEVDLPMKFNRLIIYPANIFHKETNFFDGRLVQTFFMNRSENEDDLFVKGGVHNSDKVDKIKQEEQ